MLVQVLCKICRPVSSIEIRHFYYFPTKTVEEIKKHFVVVHLSHSCECDILLTIWGDLSNFGTNANLDSRMSWLIGRSKFKITETTGVFEWDIWGTPLKESLQNLHKLSLGIKDELIRLWFVTSQNTFGILQDLHRLSSWFSLSVRISSLKLLLFIYLRHQSKFYCFNIMRIEAFFTACLPEVQIITKCA